MQHLGSVAGEFIDKLIKEYENILTDQEIITELVEQVEMYKTP
jgi:hypothetical protein